MYGAEGPLSIVPLPELMLALTRRMVWTHTKNVAAAMVAAAIIVQMVFRLVFMAWSSQNMMKGMANGPAGRIHAQG